LALMFARVAALVERRAALVVGVWVVLAVWLTLTVPSLSSLGAADRASFLPHEARTSQTQDVLRRAFPDDPPSEPAVIVLDRAAGLTEGDRAYIDRLAAFLGSPAAAGHVQRVQTAVTSPELAPVLRAADGRAELVVVALRAGPLTEGSNRAVAFVRRHLAATAPGGLDHHVTGLSALLADQARVVQSGLGQTAFVTAALVLLILILVYRSLVAPFLSLVSIGVAFLVARGLVALLAQRGVQVASLAETWMVVFAFGAGTDYCLFVISRYREELRPGSERVGALTGAVRAVGPVITASAGTVIFAFLAFFAARLLLLRSVGPAFTVAIAVVLLASLTLTPALLRLAGRHSFWPGPALAPTGSPDRWIRVAGLVERHPAPLLIGGVALLLAPSAGLFSMHESFDLVTELPASAESRRGFQTLAAHYPSGALSPLYLVVDADRSLLDHDALAAVDRLTDTLRRNPGLSEVRSVTQPAGAPLTLQNLPALTGGHADIAALGLVPGPVDVAPLASALASPAGLRLDARILTASPALRQRVGFFLSSDAQTTRLVLALRGNPYDRRTFEVIRRLPGEATRALAGSPLAGSRLIVGGPGAFLVDFQDTADGDFRVIAALALAAVLVILTLVLRSPVAPLYLLPSVLLSFTAAMGLTVIVFQGLLHQPGLSFWLPTFLFAVLVALGADYNIFITGRIREELDAGAAPIDAVRQGLVLTGGVITSAGLILAGTFAALLLSPLPFLQQSGFAIATGVLLDTFVVRTLLVPAAAVLLGRFAFWPSGTTSGSPAARPRVAVTLAHAGIAALTAGLLYVAATRTTPDPFHRIPAGSAAKPQTAPAMPTAPHSPGQPASTTP
jgi:uncharacterized membrane protein YdfJ with MMPL/SSD domain